MGKFLTTCLFLFFVFKISSFANENVPKNWPWKGITFAVSLLDNNNLSNIEKINYINGNMVRLHVNLKRDLIDTKLTVSELIEKNLLIIDRALDKCKENNLTAIIAFSDFPLEDSRECHSKFQKGYWENPICIRRMLEISEYVMNRFKSRGNELTGYQFMAEPAKKMNGRRVAPKEWPLIFKTIVTLRNKIDKNRYLIYTPGPGASNKGYKNFKPLLSSNIIYNFHMYEPGSYTHQMIFKDRFRSKLVYPGWINYSYWDKEKIKKRLRFVRNFQTSFNKLVMVGEFNAVNWAKGREQYLSDLISIFKEYHWSWVFFGYVLYNGWNPDYELYNEKEKTLKNKGFKTDTWKLLKKM